MTFAMPLLSPTKALGIQYPIMCAGMGHVTGAELAAAVSNAGGIGTIGAIAMSPEGMRAEIKKLKSLLKKGDSISGTIPYGVDLLLPQIGGKARKTNKVNGEAMSRETCVKYIVGGGGGFIVAVRLARV
jgi:enoyl reductase-like protein